MSGVEAIQADEDAAQDFAEYRHRLASTPVSAGEVERAWRDGWTQCKASLTEDEAFCLTDDVEQDAWLDSSTRAALTSPAQEGGK